LLSDEREDSKLTFTLIDSKRIFSGSVFDVDRDRLLDRNGTELVREVVRHPGGAGGLPLFEDGRVSLVRQYRHPARTEILEIPAGRMEIGESPADCAAREIEDEIGFRPGRVEKLAEFYSTPGFCQEKLFVYLATELRMTEQRLDHDEDVRVVTLPLDEAVRMAESGEIEDSKTIIALLVAQRAIAVRR
jgi:ADP-ribose pyrophosphatase